MVILQPDKLEKWLKLIGHNYSWLADKLGISNGYVSQLSNGNEVSGEMISQLLTLTHFKFELLFEIVPTPDNPNCQKHNYKKFRKRREGEK